MTTKRYRVWTGRASWHQQRAGHFYAGSMEGRYTDQELTNLVSNLLDRAPQDGGVFAIDEIDQDGRLIRTVDTKAIAKQLGKAYLHL